MQHVLIILATTVYVIKENEQSLLYTTQSILHPYKAISINWSCSFFRGRRPWSQPQPTIRMLRTQNMTTSGPRPVCRGGGSSRVSQRLQKPISKDTKKQPPFMHSRQVADTVFLSQLCFHLLIMLRSKLICINSRLRDTCMASGCVRLITVQRFRFSSESTNHYCPRTSWTCMDCMSTKPCSFWPRSYRTKSQVLNKEVCSPFSSPWQTCNSTYINLMQSNLLVSYLG